MKNKFHIQKIKPTELDRLNQIANELNSLHCEELPNVFNKISEEFSVEEIERINKSKSEGLIGAYIVNELNGFLHYLIEARSESKFMKPEMVLKIHELGVSKESQQLGIGSELINEAIKIAKDENITRIILSVWSFNKNASDFYSNAGFSEVKREMELNI